MSFLANDPLTQLAFSVYENKGVFAVLLGSGASRAAQIPTGWEITLDLVRRMAAAQGIEDQPDWGKWYRDTSGSEPNYSALLEEIASTSEERRSILDSYIEPTDADREEGRKLPTPAHKAIAELVRAGFVRVIVTTNFDRLMENALREAGIEPTIVSSADALAGASPLTHSRCYLLKLHGDYKDARILNTDSELSAYPKLYNKLLDRIFDEHGLIISGWSGEWDPALRAAMLRAPSRRYPFFWTVRGNIADSTQKLVEHRQAKVVSISGADEFFAALQQRVETLEKSHRPSPHSVELLVGNAKRFLAKPEYRIQLDELLSQEAERVLSQLESPDFQQHGSVGADEARTRVCRYEAIIEPLAKIAGVMGRWGDGSDLSSIRDVIRALHRHATSGGSGLTVWLNLRGYPAVLVLIAYGLGLTQAQRWTTLHDLFETSIATRHHNEPKRFVDDLFLNSWNGGENDFWQGMEGLERHHTALSDHLLEVMTEWKASFAGALPDFELVFDRLGILGSLAFFEKYDEAALDDSLKADVRNSFQWMPVGRIGWHGESREKLLQELASDEFSTALLKAGFSHNSRPFLELFVRNLNLIAGRMRW